MDLIDYEISKKIADFICIINGFFSLLTLIIIYKIPYKNDFNSILIYLTITQTIFDFSFLANTPQLVVSIASFSGLATALFTLLISCLLSYTIRKRKYIDVEYYKNKILFLIMTISISFGVVIYLTFLNSFIAMDVYIKLRLIIVFLIIVLLLFTFFTLDEMKLNRKLNGKYHAIYILAKRLCMYPIIQLITRLPVTVYAIIYKETWLEYSTVQNPSIIQFFMFTLTYLTLYSGGIGNFIAFYYSNRLCKSILLNIFFCRNIDLNHNKKKDIRLTEETINKIYTNDDRNSTLQRFDEHSSKPTVNIDDFEYTDANFTEIDYNELDEEQLARYIEILERQNPTIIEMS